MNESLWSDDEFRAFFSDLRGEGLFSSGADDCDRDGFRAQALLRVAPEVQRRVLADIGIPIDASGIAATALDVLEGERWGKRRTWILVAPDPWRLLCELVTREIRRSYRAHTPRRADERALAGIAQASTRASLTVGDDEQEGGTGA